MGKEIEKMNDKELLKHAKKLGVEITEDLDREEVELLVILKQEELEKSSQDNTDADAPPEENQPGAPETEEPPKDNGDDKSSKIKNLKDKDKVALQYLGKGSIRKFGKEWKFNKRDTVSGKEAKELIRAFGHRFKVLSA